MDDLLRTHLSNLPRYESERLHTTIWVMFVSIFWFLVAPLLLSSRKKPKGSKPSSTTTTTVAISNGNVKRKIVRKKKQPALSDPAEEKSATTGVEPTTTPWWATAISCMGWMATILYLTLQHNPHNYYTARRVFQAPLFSLEECHAIIQMAHDAAERNALSATQEEDNHNNATQRRLLEEPRGWQKARHDNYPTTDLNLVTDPFLPQDRHDLGHLLDRRLAPLLANFYGIPPSSIRANDVFVVRYDAQFSNQHLRNHTDDSDISFNVLLNRDFEGGGTQFWNRQTERPFAHVQPTEPGTVLTHAANIHHEGVPITSGSRWILVGFLSVDHKQPFTGIDTGLSVYASWLNVAWLHRRFKESYVLSWNRRVAAITQPPKQKKWTDHMYVRMLFVDLVNILQYLGDVFGTHAVETLVEGQPSQQKTEFLKELDAHFDQTDDGTTNRRASWWKGQQIQIDIDGSVGAEWATRTESKDSFQEL